MNKNKITLNETEQNLKGKTRNETNTSNLFYLFKDETQKNHELKYQNYRCVQYL